MYIAIESSGAAGSPGATVGSAAVVGTGASVGAPPHAARIMLASTKAANRTYRFLRIFSFLLVVVFICCHHNKRLLIAMEEQVNIWLIKKTLKALNSFRVWFSEVRLSESACYIISRPFFLRVGEQF
jgi:hypothetical protein